MLDSYSVAMKNMYGTTPILQDGWLLPDGTTVKLRGTHATMAHRALSIDPDHGKWDLEAMDDIREFGMKTGAIRIISGQREANIDIWHPPTPQQLDTLKYLYEVPVKVEGCTEYADPIRRALRNVNVH